MEKMIQIQKNDAMVRDDVRDSLKKLETEVGTLRTEVYLLREGVAARFGPPPQSFGERGKRTAGR